MNGFDVDLVDSTRAVLDALEVPDGRTRTVVLELADLTQNPDSPGHMAVAGAALASAMGQLREMYKKRSPLEQERDILRGQRHLRELRERGEIE